MSAASEARLGEDEAVDLEQGDEGNGGDEEGELPVSFIHRNGVACCNPVVQSKHDTPGATAKRVKVKLT